MCPKNLRIIFRIRYSLKKKKKLTEFNFFKNLQNFTSSRVT